MFAQEIIQNTGTGNSGQSNSIFPDPQLSQPLDFLQIWTYTPIKFPEFNFRHGLPHDVGYVAIFLMLEGFYDNNNGQHLAQIAF